MKPVEDMTLEEIGALSREEAIAAVKRLLIERVETRTRLENAMYLLRRGIRGSIERVTTSDHDNLDRARRSQHE